MDINDHRWFIRADDSMACEICELFFPFFVKIGPLTKFSVWLHRNLPQSVKVMSNVLLIAQTNSHSSECNWFAITLNATINHEFFVIILGRGGSAGGKFRISLGMPVGAVINCADNTGQSIVSHFVEHISCIFTFKTEIDVDHFWFCTFQVVRTCTLSLSMAFVVAWTDCQPPVLVTCSSLPSRRVNQNWERRYELICTKSVPFIGKECD